MEVHSLAGDDVARCDAVLAPAEREQVRRFHFDADRDAYRAAHALLRFALSSVEPAIRPRDWAFEAPPQGRPEIAPGLPPLRFNITHTRGMVACIVSRGLACGIDVESVPRFHGLDHLARVVLSPEEQAALAASPEPERPHHFSRYWTLKEAYSKALGLGMSMPFEKITFELENGAGRLRDSPRGWHFEQWSPGRDFILAVAVETHTPLGLIRHAGLPPSL